jgi:thiol-disulfide isomerase/thioredoxin
MDAISRRNALANFGYFLAIPSSIFALDQHAEVVNFKAKTLDGEMFTTESVQGKVVLVQFWATWCPYCKGDAPAVDTMFREFRDQGLEVLAVNVGETRKTVTKFLAENPRNCKIVLMTDTNLAAWFAPKSFPHYAVIGRNGSESGEQKGAGGELSLRHLLRKAGLRADGPDSPGQLNSSPRRS